MKQIDDLLEMLQDSDIDRTEPLLKNFLNIPKLHSKYLNILSKHRLLSKEMSSSITK